MGPEDRFPQLRAMGSLLTMLPVAPKLRALNIRLQESFSRKGWSLVRELATEALALLLGLLLVASFVAFFYLYCLPWVGIH